MVTGNDAALILKDIEHLQETTESGFEGTNKRLDRLNGTVAKNSESIHSLDRRTVAIETTCRERTSMYKETEVKEKQSSIISVGHQLINQQTAKYGAAVLGGTGVTMIILLLLRAWGYL